MELLSEVADVKQIPGETPRRWFASLEGDLFTWQRDGRLTRFEYCYNKPYNEHVLIWTLDQGFGHFRIDDGESDPMHNRAPIAIADGVWDPDTVRWRLEATASGIEPALYRQILTVLYRMP